MTKAKLRRLMDLWMLKGLEQGLLPALERPEFQRLQAEFEAWEPEAATANGQTARYWMNLAQQYAEECITLRHKARG